MEPQDMPVLHTKTRQRWSGDRRVVEGTIDQIMNICLFLSSPLSLPTHVFLPLLPPHLHTHAHTHRLYTAATAFLGLP